MKRLLPESPLLRAVTISWLVAAAALSLAMKERRYAVVAREARDVKATPPTAAAATETTTAGKEVSSPPPADEGNGDDGAAAASTGDKNLRGAAEAQDDGQPSGQKADDNQSAPLRSTMALPNDDSGSTDKAMEVFFPYHGPHPYEMLKTTRTSPGRPFDVHLGTAKATEGYVWRAAGIIADGSKPLPNKEEDLVQSLDNLPVEGWSVTEPKIIPRNEGYGEGTVTSTVKADKTGNSYLVYDLAKPSASKDVHIRRIVRVVVS